LENILLDANDNAKLCDFGWSTPQKVEGLTLFCGTLDYMAPELLGLVNNKVPYNQAVDVWSLGILLFELLHGFPPFPGDDPQQKTLSIHK
jgi:serine/threonine protein kinase